MVDLLHLPDGERGWGGAGTVHHVAWRTLNNTEQLAWRQEIADRGLRVTSVTDRQYFRSIYFREPGGVLFLKRRCLSNQHHDLAGSYRLPVFRQEFP